MIALFELTFVPRGPDAPEGDGYLVVPVSRLLENRSEFVILILTTSPPASVAAVAARRSLSRGRRT
jgi:carotenoid cleavage dioxygenase-like enzyme